MSKHFLAMYDVLSDDRFKAIFGPKPEAAPEPPAEPTPKRRKADRTEAAQPATIKAATIRPVAACPEPGIYFGVPFAEYLEWNAVNNTLLSHAAQSMAHFKTAMEDGPFESSDAQASFRGAPHRNLSRLRRSRGLGNPLADFPATTDAANRRPSRDRLKRHPTTGRHHRRPRLGSRFPFRFSVS